MPASPWRLGLIFAPLSFAIYFALLTFLHNRSSAYR